MDIRGLAETGSLRAGAIYALGAACHVAHDPVLSTGGPLRNPAFAALLESVVESYRSRFLSLLDEIMVLHEAKNHDYAADDDPLSNFRESERLGVPVFHGIMVRLGDKWSRACQLTKAGKTARNESLRDTLIDQAVYSLISVLVLDEQDGA